MNSRRCSSKMRSCERSSDRWSCAKISRRNQSVFGFRRWSWRWRFGGTGICIAENRCILWVRKSCFWFSMKLIGGNFSEITIFLSVIFGIHWCKWSVLRKMIQNFTKFWGTRCDVVIFRCFGSYMQLKRSMVEVRTIKYIILVVFLGKSQFQGFLFYWLIDLISNLFQFSNVYV